MVRNVQATGATGLRKNRVTQKTRLRVVRGELDVDALVLDDEEERNRVLASQGVDAEDANEHHLQVVLNGKQVQSDAHIPTPDAAGLVANYDALYPLSKFRQPTTHLRFSESADECIEGGLAGGFTYFLDERDAEWLNKSNQEARGEGTSASAANGMGDDFSVSSTRSGRTLHNKKHKGKEPEHAHAFTRVAVDENEFELIMGLFEKFTEEKFPFIHLSLDNFPPFADYEPMFSAPLPPTLFASYLLPASVPPPEQLVLAAHTVYPHWKARKVEREGQRVVPQLDYNDTHESSYICFRRRDVKPVRRTRASSTAYTDKLVRLRAELQTGIDLVKMVMEREQVKMDAVSAAQGVWRARCKLVEEWRAGDGKASGMGVDESLLFDKERAPKKPKVEGLGRIILGLNRRPTGPQSASGTPNNDQHSPLTAHLDLSMVNSLSAQAYVAIQSSVHERYKYVQNCVDREMNSLRAREAGWEDMLDLPYQAPPVPHSEKAFRSCDPPSASNTSTLGIDSTRARILDAGEPSTSQSPLHPGVYDASLPPLPTQSPIPSDIAPQSHPTRTSASLASQRLPRSLRLRTGRGGRLHLDRQLHFPRAHPLLNVERARWPRTDTWLSLHKRRDDWERNEGARWAGGERRPGRGSSSGKSTEKDCAHWLGEEYWAHESVHEKKHIELGKRKREECESGSEEVGIRFEYGGYGLGLVTATQWERGQAVEGSQQKLEPQSRGNEGDPEGGPDSMEWSVEGRTAEEAERAWRVTERWRYDADAGREEEDRLLLDDFQPKFVRTMITLLDSADHEALKTDAKNLTPPHVPDATPQATRISSRLGEQERARLTNLKSQRLSSSLQAQPMSMLSPHPSAFQNAPAPSTTPPLPLPQISSASGRMEEQIRRMARQTPSLSPTAAVTPQTSQRTSLSQVPLSTPTPSQPNGTPQKSTPYTNGIGSDNGATVRVSTPVRPQSHSPQQPQPQPQQGTTMNGLAPHQRPNHLTLHPGHAHGLNPQQYAALRNVFAEPVSGAQQQAQQGRAPMQITGVPTANVVNLQMGPGSLNLKLPQSRPGQLRMNGTSGVEVNGVVTVGGQHAPMLTTPPRANGGSPAPHHARVNGHMMTPNNGNASPVNAHLLGRASPLTHAALSTSPHHSHLVPLHTTPQLPPTAPLVHQQVVGGAGQGHGYS